MLSYYNNRGAQLVTAWEPCLKIDWELIDKKYPEEGWCNPERALTFIDDTTITNTDWRVRSKAFVGRDSAHNIKLIHWLNVNRKFLNMNKHYNNDNWSLQYVQINAVSQD